MGAFPNVMNNNKVREDSAYMKTTLASVKENENSKEKLRQSTESNNINNEVMVKSVFDT